MAPPGFCNRGEVRYESIGGLEYEVPQSRLYCLYINVALCSTALQCICRVIRRSSMTMKAHTYYTIFGRPPIGVGSFPPFTPGGATALHYITLLALASTPPGMPGTHPPIFWLGGRQRKYPPILLRTFGFSRPILVALRSLSLKPISFGYKTPPIRFSQAGGQSAHSQGSSPPTFNSR